jgi:hypothetical protein
MASRCSGPHDPRAISNRSAFLCGQVGTTESQTASLFEIAVFDPSDPVLNPMWRQGTFALPFLLL